MERTPAEVLAAGWRARVAAVSTVACPACAGSTSAGMLAALDHCSACELTEYTVRVNDAD